MKLLIILQVVISGWVTKDTIRYNPKGDTTFYESSWLYKNDSTLYQVRLNDKGIYQRRYKFIKK